MEIEQFVALSEGEWKSMRSGHSLAFQHFEEIVSTIKIKRLEKNDKRVCKLISDNLPKATKPVSPFKIDWEGDSDWEENTKKEDLSGSCILVPIPKSKEDGILIRSTGYAEKVNVVSSYNFLSDGTMIICSKYNHSVAEERIWFLTDTVRCRSSVIKSSNLKTILQTSYASEIKKL